MNTIAPAVRSALSPVVAKTFNVNSPRFADCLTDGNRKGVASLLVRVQAGRLALRGCRLSDDVISQLVRDLADEANFVPMREVAQAVAVLKEVTGLPVGFGAVRSVRCLADLVGYVPVSGKADVIAFAECVRGFLNELLNAPLEILGEGRPRIEVLLDSTWHGVFPFVVVHGLVGGHRDGDLVAWDTLYNMVFTSWAIMEFMAIEDRLTVHDDILMNMARERFTMDFVHAKYIKNKVA